MKTSLLGAAVLSAMFLSAAAGLAMAHEADTGPGPSCAQAKGNMNLRESPPTRTANWFSKGLKIDVLAKDEIVKILETKPFKPIQGFDPQQWVLVERTTGSLKKGWVYHGGEDYFKPVDCQTIRPV
jgi:hypothetical protein